MAFAKDSYWMNSGVYILASKALTLVFGFGSFFLLVRLFSKHEFGIWTLFISITALIEMARNGLVQNGQIKFLNSEPKPEHPKIVTASFVLNSLYTIVIILLLVISAQVLPIIWDASELEIMFYYYMITAGISIPFSQFEFIQHANLDFRGILFSHMVRQGLFFAFILVYFLSGSVLTLYTLVKLHIVAAFLGGLVAFVFARKYLAFSYSIDFRWFRKLFNYGRYVFGTNISSILYKSADQMILGAMVSTASVAIYNTAVRITNLVEVPTGSMSSIVFPKSAQRIKSEGKHAVKYLYERSVGLILAMIVPCLLMVMLFPEFVILVVAGDKYLDAVPILRVTLLYALFIPFGRQFGTVLDAIGKPQINFYFVLLGLVLNVVSNFFFIQYYGTIGAAYGTLLSYSVCFVLNQIVLSKILNVETFNVVLYARNFYIDGFNTTAKYLKRTS